MCGLWRTENLDSKARSIYSRRTTQPRGLFSRRLAERPFSIGRSRAGGALERAAVARVAATSQEDSEAQYGVGEARHLCLLEDCC